LDYALLGPVKPTQTHPGVTGIGWERFAELAGDLPLPVLGLGGLSATEMAEAREHGAHGIASIRSAWPARTRLSRAGAVPRRRAGRRAERGRTPKPRHRDRAGDSVQSRTGATGSRQSIARTCRIAGNERSGSCSGSCQMLQKVTPNGTSRSVGRGRHSVSGDRKRMFSANLLALISGTTRR